MAIESLVALALATAVLAGLAWYDSRHRDKGKDDPKIIDGTKKES